MSVVDPYSPCPCGSGEKYKWCCLKAEDAAIKVERLIRSEQTDQALKAVDEALSRTPEVPWLLLQKASLLERRGQVREALAAVDAILKARPDHFGALVQHVQIVIALEGPSAGAAELQLAMTRSEPDQRPRLGGLFRLLGVVLARADAIPAAIAHLEIAAGLESDEDPLARSALRSLMTDPGVTAWLKNPYDLATVPDGLNDDLRDRFDAALEAADAALWGQAAAGFETLAADGVIDAERNLGLCRLWMADDRGAVEALRRYVRAIGATSEAVDLEALCQQVEPYPADQLVERVQLIWPLNDREALLKALGKAETDERVVMSEGARPIDPDEPEAVEVESFALLDRPVPQPREGLGAADMPRIAGRLLVGTSIVALEAFDEGKQFDALRERVVELAGPSIPPAHPKTKVLDKAARVSLALRTEWVLPEELGEDDLRRIQREEQSRVIREVWPATPMPALGGRTPRQAAQAGDAEIPLRAAFCQIATNRADQAVDFDAFRAELGIPAEPTPDPDQVNIETEHLARLQLIPAERLDDERLWALYLRSRGTGMVRALERSAGALAERGPFLAGRGPTDRYAVFADLAELAAGRGETAAALAVVERARRDEPEAHRGANAPRWDLLAIRLRARSETPDKWVPDLAVVLERYREDRASSQALMSNLIDMGLVQMAPHPDQPDQVMLDSRPLMALLSRYGPRITTAEGTLGVAAGKSGIWTPGQQSGQGGGVWTPGGDQGGGGEKKLIIPGR